MNNLFNVNVHTCFRNDADTYLLEGEKRFIKQISTSICGPQTFFVVVLIDKIPSSTSLL